MKFLIATTNMGKIREFYTLMPEHEFEPLPIAYAPPAEDGKTFVENARIKARAAAGVLPVIAEDSGLCVAALGGAPGIFSARYGGYRTDRERNMYLLRQMVGKTNRAACFECAIVCVFPNGRELVSVARCNGSIVQVPRGDNGFGYDPLFEYNGSTTGEMTQGEKNLISHRGRAIRQLVRMLDRL
ncbi:MAG: RdgB/HAM1 family non-canonical purine NTP pyrophosphatase [Oscillospiraceae bacterium]|nr:RdgB/HAM1 family non-canonical purine NTP pyrophosphatase [Oscillospiraceae bacterium]